MKYKKTVLRCFFKWLCINILFIALAIAPYKYSYPEDSPKTIVSPGYYLKNSSWHKDHFVLFANEKTCIPWMHYGAKVIDKTFHIKTSCLNFAEDIYYYGDTSNPDWDSEYSSVYAYDTATGCLLEKTNEYKNTQIQLEVNCTQFAVDILEALLKF